MATLALSLAGQVVGGFLGGPIGATIGRAIGALAGAGIDDALFGGRARPEQHADFRLQGSVEGGPVPRLYGWSRLSGNIVWATELEELTAESAGGKGFGGDEETTIAASFAVAFCEGEVSRLGRIWADGQLLDTEGILLRFYRGTADQGVDSLIEAKQGAGNAPAYRDTCYIVFERLPLTAFGNRIPQIAVELCRVVGALEPAIRAVTIIPGATEFGYDPEPRVRVVLPGVTANENTHQSRSVSDWTLSIDELVALCPNLTNVALVVAWFGDDLRCGECLIQPRVEDATRAIDGAAWSVAGLTRDTAPVVSTYGGGPAYGGTPSDAAVTAAIADLTVRGIAVTLYPLVLMDVPQGNALPNPYGGTGQAAYPWRGRITCTPAPGQPGTPDVSGAVTAQIGDFVGTGSDWRFRRMVLHYAALADAAGGVDAIVIGSEMRGMSFLRDGSNGFPFVDALVELAGEVRAIVGGTKITYAADWSEFTGLQVDGDKFFHLDPLWASEDVDAVGIDNYMPLTDWRDGSDHLDAAVAGSPYEIDYLRSRIAGGEGYDWYYASDADRLDGVRSPISDGLGEPWIWRFKDLVGWWSNEHHNRVGGVRDASPTAWEAESKPIWFTELGCAAVDKGANQPNVFVDAKSAESGRPYFSDAGPDALMQRQFLRAHLGHWADPANNPAGMVDLERVYLWTWDARPYPAFPADAATWADGVNHATGHWLTGRIGGMASDELVRAIADDYGIELGEVEAAPPLVQGFVLEGVVAARDAMAPALAASGLSMRDRPEGLSLALPKVADAVEIEPDALVATDGPRSSRRSADPSERVGQVSLTYPDRERGYLTGTVTAAGFEPGAAAGERLGLVLDAASARTVAERLLAAEEARDTLELTLPPSMLALEAGDTIRVEGQRAGAFEIGEVRDGEARRITARAVAEGRVGSVISERPAASPLAGSAGRSIPLVAAMHLPPLASTPTQSRLAFAAWASPWPGEVTIVDDATGISVASIPRGAVMGELDEALGDGVPLVWDDETELMVRLHWGHLSSKDEATVLAGGNHLAVETDAGEWEVLGFQDAELVSAGLYRLTMLMRGRQGTDHAVGPAAAGKRVVVLGDRVIEKPVPAEWLGETLTLRAYAGPTDPTGQTFDVALSLTPVLPLAPVELSAERDGMTDDVTITWTRRSRAGAGVGGGEPPLEHAPESYRVTIYDGVTPVRTADVAAPARNYTAAEQTADFGAPPAAFTFTVAQRSAVFGLGHEAEGAFDD